METLRLTEDRTEHLLETYTIKPNEKIGQHFLLDAQALSMMVEEVTPGSIVIEIGPGLGDLTKAVAKKASKVVAIEVDHRFEPILDSLQADFPNVQIIYGDALEQRFGSLTGEKSRDHDVQLVSNLPYHIAEPLLRKLTTSNFDRISLLVGKRLALSLLAKNEDSVDYTTMTALANAFFNIELITQVDKKMFYPVPKTDGTIVRLTPREAEDYRQSVSLFLLKNLFSPANKNISIKECLKRSFVTFYNSQKTRTLSKAEASRKTRREHAEYLRHLTLSDGYADSTRGRTLEGNVMTPAQALELVSLLKLSEDSLNQPFDRISNSELRILISGINDIAVNLKHKKKSKSDRN